MFSVKLAPPSPFFTLPFTGVRGRMRRFEKVGIGLVTTTNQAPNASRPAPRILLNTISTMHCMTVLSEQGGAGLGDHTATKD